MGGHGRRGRRGNRLEDYRTQDQRPVERTQDQRPERGSVVSDEREETEAIRSIAVREGRPVPSANLTDKETE
jgi:hypothetical protein